MSSNKRRNENDKEGGQPSTPKRTCTPLPMDTPYSRNTAIHSSHTSTGDADLVSKQEELLKDMEYELRNVLYQGIWVRESLCPDTHNITEQVLHELSVAQTIHYNPDGQTISISAWPGPGSSEPRFYEPLVKLLNAIIEAIERLKPERDSVLKGAKFYGGGKAMLESVAGEPPIKPDVVATKVDLNMSPNSPSWYRTDLVAEVKNNWKTLIFQAGTYARCMFAASDHRFFVPIIAFNHRTSKFRLCFFHRCGVLATTPADILTRVGFCDFVRTIIGLWSWSTWKDAGYEPSQTHNLVRLNDEDYRIRRVLCRRQVIHGRATQVLSVTRQQPTLEGEGESGNKKKERVYLREHSTTGNNPPVSKRLNRVWKRLDPFDEYLSECPPAESRQVVLREGTLPAAFVIKCSYLTPERDPEEQVFESVQGYLGIPRILGGYEAHSLNVPLGETVLPWKVSPDFDSRPYQPRRHRHLLIETIGQRLEEAKGPRALAEGLRDALAGHCALFTIGGYLHRDISDGNIILLDAHEERQVPELLRGIIANNSCSGVLIDGDVAKKWGSDSESIHRSGTRPFISCRLLGLWSNISEGKEDPLPAQHTPIDDLESFVWVLFRTVLSLAKSRTSIEYGWWVDLHADDLRSLRNAKIAIRSEFSEPGYQKSPMLLAFNSLLDAWFHTSSDFEKRLKALLVAKTSSIKDIEALSQKAYRRYAQDIEMCLLSIPLSWP